MEGWDGTPDGVPSDRTIRRWQHFGLSGAKLIWGGEAVAVHHNGRANPNQLLINPQNLPALENLRHQLIEAHRQNDSGTDDLVVGLQLTHSGRFCRPNHKDRLEPRIAYAHPVLDARFHIDPETALLGDDDLRRIIDCFIAAAEMAHRIGFDFVDIKHCHGYLGHELLGAFTREGDFGGSFENRTRFLRDIVEGIRAEVPDLTLAIRLSAFDTPPYQPHPTRGRKLGPGIPACGPECLPYHYGFGMDADEPLRPDLAETIQLLELLRRLDIRLVNISAGSPYYNPHVQRPALYPPSDGYGPPEDPLVGVARQIHVTRQLKERFADLVLVGSGYSYLQEFLPHVATAAVGRGWVDLVGLGRMVLSYPEFPRDLLAGNPLRKKRICRTFSDCTTAPRNGLVSGCYPLDPYYKNSPEMAKLRAAKAARG